MSYVNCGLLKIAPGTTYLAVQLPILALETRSRSQEMTAILRRLYKASGTASVEFWSTLMSRIELKLDLDWTSTNSDTRWRNFKEDWTLPKILDNFTIVTLSIENKQPIHLFPNNIPQLNSIVRASGSFPASWNMALIFTGFSTWRKSFHVWNLWISGQIKK